MAKPIELSPSQHERRRGKGTIDSKFITPSRDSCPQAHLYILYHISNVHLFLNEHFDILRAKNLLKGIKHRYSCIIRYFLIGFIIELYVNNLRACLKMLSGLVFPHPYIG